MTTTWTPIVELDHALITQFVWSPDFAVDRTLFACSLAGLHISVDAGDTWLPVAHGVVGPFTSNIVLTSGTGSKGSIVTTSPAGLFRSIDGGESWDVVAGAIADGLLAQLTKNSFLVISPESGEVWRGRLDTKTLEVASPLPGQSLDLQSGRDERVLALTTTGTYRTEDGGSSWREVTVPSPERVRAIAGGFTEDLFVMTDCGIYRLESGQDLTFVCNVPHEQPSALVVSAGGASFVVAVDAQLFVSSDSGENWTARRLEAPVTALAMSCDGGMLIAGLETGHVVRSNDLGEHWRLLPLPAAAVVTGLRANGSCLQAATVDGATFQFDEGHDRWLRRDIPGELEPHVLAYASSGLQVRLEDKELFLIDDDGTSSTWATPPVSDDERVVDLVAGIASIKSGVTVSVAVQDRSGFCTVWVKHATEPWRRVIAHPTSARSVSLAMIGGARGLFAAIGNCVYRPARVGSLLYASEVVDPDHSLEVLQLRAIAMSDGAVLLCVLTTNGLYASQDRGITWNLVPSPMGPPVTAIALQDRPESQNILVVQIGGMVSSLELSTESHTLSQ